MAVMMASAFGRNYGRGIPGVPEETSYLVLSEGTIYPIFNSLWQNGRIDCTRAESELGHARRY